MPPNTAPKPGCLAGLFGLFLHGSKNTRRQWNDQWPYRLRDDFLSDAEASFYHVLISVVGAQLTICPKVGLKEIFWVTGQQNNQSHWNRINQKHVDFLLCRPGTLHPVVGIELDDSSHTAQKRQQRDADVEQIFEAAQLPLLRFAVRRSYSTQVLADALAPYLEPPASPARPPETLVPDAPASGAAPHCPKCGALMVVRFTRQGPNANKPFYACPNYPQCKSVIPIKNQSAQAAV